MGKFLCLILFFSCFTHGCSAAPKSQGDLVQVPRNRQWVLDEDPKKIQVSISETKVTDASLLLVHVRWSQQEKLPEQAAQAIKGKFGDKEFYFFPSGDGEYTGLFGVPYLYQPGKTQVSVTILTEPAQTIELPFEVTEAVYRSEMLTVDPSKVSPPKKAMARIKKEIEEVGQVYRTITPSKLWQSPFKLPLDSPVTSEFGTKRVYNGKLSNFHNGLDLKAAVGTPIYSTAPGRVALSKDLYYTGHTVIVDHGLGLFTLYAHMTKRSVKKGQEVKAGQKLGLSGMTGRVSGPHLHWAAIVQGVKINPMELLRVIQ